MTAPRLTTRQSQIAALIAHGLTSREIGSELGIAEATVKRHIHNALSTHEAPSRSCLAMLYVEGCLSEILTALDALDVAAGKLRTAIHHP